MEPADGVDDLLSAIELIDPYSVILHGHKHDIMPVDYSYKTHQVGAPGGFAESLRLNLIDFDTQGQHILTQVQLRV